MMVMCYGKGIIRQKDKLAYMGKTKINTNEEETCSELNRQRKHMKQKSEVSPRHTPIDSSKCACILTRLEQESSII